MNTPVQSSNQRRSELIGSAFITTKHFYLEEFETLSTYSWDSAKELQPGEIITLVDVQEHPEWKDCFALKFLYNNLILYCSMYKAEFDETMLKEFIVIC
jgi:hypothetical protein